MDAANRVLEVVRTLVAELHTGPPVRLALDSSLDRDLGLDSLARVELHLRLQRTFGVDVSEEVLMTGETLQDLVEAVETARPAPRPAAPTDRRPPALERVEAEPAQATTLIEVLDWHVRTHPDRMHVFLYGEGQREETISYVELKRGAADIAAGLAERGLAPGQAVGIMLPTSREYLYTFFGILLAGGVPVPIYPPARLTQVEDHIRRHAGILSNAQAAFLITVSEAKALAMLLRAQVESMRDVLTPAELFLQSARLPHISRKADDIAFLQYTSGSTGNPKGVVLTHNNLLANIRAMGQATRANSSDVYVSWLPLYHDMGLIASWLASAYYAIPLILMSPLAFLARPQRWLWAIHRHRGTVSGAPNFAYELCLRRIEDRDLEGLDLSSWRLAYNGAEPVSPETVSGFVERFAKYGFRAEAMAPVFGLAECAVDLTYPAPGRGPVIDRVQREPFMATGRALLADPEDERALRFVACGRPLPGHEIRIVDAAGLEVSERQQGGLEFRGPSATSGYFRNPEQTRKLFHDKWLDTGDLAYVAAGDLYLTGRAKDLIIRGGRHIHPYELEDAVGALPGIRRGCVAVFGSADPRTGTERLIVLAETRESDAQAKERLRRAIIDRALGILGMPPDDVVLAAPHTVLKTSSGKIRRAASREFYERGSTAEQRRPVWWQLARLGLAGIAPQARRWRHTVEAILYAAYAWSLFGLFVLPTWLAVALLPRPSWSWAAARTAARLLLRLSNAPFAVTGLENVPVGEPYIVVTNHASYLDGMFFVAAWPEPLHFIAKAEFRDRFVPGTFLKRLGADFVERFDLKRGAEDASRLAGTARAGQRLAFFPEGTFTRTPGLAPFHLGAFVVAAQAGVPILPVAIKGTRSVLRAESWLPRRNPVAIVISAPIAPEGNDWGSAVRLRNTVRAQVIRDCGEPDLAG